MKNTALIMVPFFWPKLPPLGLAHLFSYLEENNICCDVYDLNIRMYNRSDSYLKKIWERLDKEKDADFADDIFLTYRHQLDEIISKGYQFVGFSVFNTNLFLALKTAKYLKDKDPSLKIIFGGPEVFYLKQRVKNFVALYDFVDFFVEGEGELNFLNIINGTINDKVPAVKEEVVLDNYPFAKFLEPERYVRKKALPILFSRGCLRRCRFCSECMLFGKYRQRSPEKLFEEILLRYKEGVKWFTFHDSLFNPSYESLHKLCRLIIDSGIEIKWDAQIAVFKWMDASLFKLMKEAGCFNVFVGLESGSDTMLKKMQKGYTSSEAANFFKNAKEADLHLEVSLIVGFPGETDVEFSETIAFFRNNKHNIPKVAQVNPFIVLEGSKIYVEGVDYSPSKTATDRKIAKLLEVLKQEKIAYTNAFINNLVSK